MKFAQNRHFGRFFDVKRLGLTGELCRRYIKGMAAFFKTIVYFFNEIIYIFIIKVNQNEGKAMKDSIIKAAKRHGNLLTTALAVRQGVSKTMLAKYVANDELVHVQHGLYALPGAIIDDMLALHLQNPNVIFSHESALFLNDFAERAPFTHSVTTRSDKVLPPSVKEQCSCFYVKPEFLKLGLTRRKTTFGNMVPCYDAERTLCDILKRRRRIADETVVAAIKNYAKLPQKDLFKLYDYATKLSVISIIKQYMEVLI
jgi:predicted transcriptional regulator of viral defense system